MKVGVLTKAAFVTKRRIRISMYRRKKKENMKRTKTFLTNEKDILDHLAMLHRRYR